MKLTKLINRLHFFAWIVFIIGVIFYSLHWRGGGFTALAACFMMFVFSIIIAIRNKRDDFYKTAYVFTFTFVSIYVLSRILFMKFSNVFLLLSFLSGIISIILIILKKRKISLYQILMIGYFICMIPLSFTPTHKIFFVLYRNVIVNDKYNGRIIRELVLNKYSWFLYSSGRFSEAESVNNKAVLEARKCEEYNNQYSTEVNLLERIESNGELIKNRNWENYLE